MRREPTGPERILWRHLRARRLGDFKFRRQEPFNYYIVDFYCHAARLVIEVDGEGHAFQQAYDNERTRWLESQDVAVLRFQNSMVRSNLTGVLAAILAECERRAPPLVPPPWGFRGGTRGGPRRRSHAPAGPGANLAFSQQPPARS